jgi:hypothetical protein
MKMTIDCPWWSSTAADMQWQLDALVLSYLQLNNPLRASRHGEKALRQLVLLDLSRFVQMDLDMRKAQCSCPRLRKQCDNEDRSVVQ